MNPVFSSRMSAKIPETAGHTAQTAGPIQKTEYGHIEKTHCFRQKLTNLAQKMLPFLRNNKKPEMIFIWYINFFTANPEKNDP